MPVLSSIGGDTGFIKLNQSPRLDVTSIDKYYDALLKAQMYVQKRMDDGKPDIEVYKKKLEDIKGRSGDVSAAARNLSDLASGLQTGVSKIGGGDWHLYSQSPEFKDQMNKFGQWTSQLSSVENNLKLAEGYEKSAADPKDGIWAKMNGKLVYADANGLNTDGRGVPVKRTAFGQFKRIKPNVDQNGTVVDDVYVNEAGSFEDVQDALNKAFTGLGKTGYETDPTLRPLADGLGGYITALTSTSGSNNYKQVESARAGFLNSLQNSSSRAYNGLKDSYYDYKLKTESAGQKPMDEDKYIDVTIGNIINGKLDATQSKAASHLPGIGGASDSYDKGSGYWNNIREGINGLGGDYERPLLETGFFTKDDGVYQTKNVNTYQLYAPEKPKVGEPLGPGTKLSSLEGISISTPAGFKNDVKDLNGYLTGNIIDQKALWQTYDNGKWRLLNSDEVKQANLGSGTAYDPNKYRLGTFYKTGIVTTSESASKIKGVSEKDRTNSTGVVSSLYEPGWLINGVNDPFKDDKSVKARQINSDDEIVKEMAKVNPDVSMDFADTKGNWKDGDAVYFEGWVEVNPSNYIAYDKPYDKYYIPANAHTMEKLKAAGGSYVSPQLKANTAIK